MNETTAHWDAADQAGPRSEAVLDSLLSRIEVQGRPGDDRATLKTDPLDRLRDQVLCELTPVLLELAEKYADRGVTIQMDAANFLQGGRGIRFEFGVGRYRHVLQGTVTNEAIAFEEVRYSPNSDGDIVSGPSLRLRLLNAESFRNFLCQRVIILLKQAVKGA